MPTNIYGEDFFKPISVSPNGQMVLIKQVNEAGEAKAYIVLDVISKKIVFEQEQINKIAIGYNYVCFIDNDNNLFKFYFTNGKKEFISNRVDDLYIYNNNILFIKNQYLISDKADKLNTHIGDFNEINFIEKNNNLYCILNSKVIKIDPHLKLKTFEIQESDKILEKTILNDHLLLFKSHDYFKVADFITGKTLSTINTDELYLGKLSDLNNCFVFKNNLIINNLYGFHTINLVDNANYSKFTEYEDLYYYDYSDNHIVTGDRSSNKLKIFQYSNYSIKEINISMPDDFIDQQLNKIQKINDSLFLIGFRWSESLLLNLHNYSLVKTNISGSLKAVNEKSFQNIYDNNIFFIDTNGPFALNLKSNEKELLGYFLKNIKLVSNTGEELIFYEHYPWLGPSSPDDLKSIYYYDLNSLSLLNKEEFEPYIEESEEAPTEILSYYENFNDAYNNSGFDLKNRIAYYIGNDNANLKIAIGEKSEKLILITDAYYMANKNDVKNLNFYINNRKLSFEQIDIIYNRPDIVLERIGRYFDKADQELIAGYRATWEKRIDKLGLDKEKIGKGEIAVPEAEILNAEQINYENTNGQVVIHVKAYDPKYNLRRYNVLVNEVPVFGSQGISIAELNTNKWQRTDTITLSIGTNKIQVSVMNELGLENFKYPTYVNYSPSYPVTAKTLFIGIGVNHFADSRYNLKYCVKDIKDLAQDFSKYQTLVDTLLLTDKEVTRENVMALRAYIMKNTTENDKVIISCSSHGLLDDSLNFYLAMHDIDFKKPTERGLKYEELESLLDSIPARQKLLLLDACNSGENDKTEILKQELKLKETTLDSAQLLASRGVLIEMQEENQNNFKKMNEMFVNVRNNTGSVIISAAGGKQNALEGSAVTVDGKEISNGAFTYSVLEYFRKNKENSEEYELSVNKLKDYVEKRVEEITNGKQKPTSRQETMEVDWKVME